MLISRRRLLGGLGLGLMAPAIVRVESLMRFAPIRPSIAFIPQSISSDRMMREIAELLSDANLILNESDVLLRNDALFQTSIPIKEWRKLIGHSLSY